MSNKNGAMSHTLQIAILGIFFELAGSQQDPLRRSDIVAVNRAVAGLLSGKRTRSDNKPNVKKEIFSS